MYTKAYRYKILEENNVAKSINRRVVKYRKRRHINIGMIVFAVILIYISVYMFVYLTRDKVTIYEVVTGKNASITNKTYSGLILRDETVVNTDTSGYLNYFVKEGDRVSLSSTVYTIDESGQISSILSSASDNGKIVYTSDDELNMRNIVSQYTQSSSDINFDAVYDFKVDLESEILESINLNNIQNLLESSESSGMEFKINKAAITGIVAYYTDGYEEKTEATLTKSDFDLTQYKKASHTSGDLIAAGDSAYKVVNKEDWHLYFELSQDEVDKYKEDTAIRIKILTDNREISGDFKIVYIGGQAYGKIHMNKYMNTYVKERFLEIQIVESQIEGLKIPKTSVVEKEFFIIPVGFAGNGGDSTNIGFYKRVYDENQKESIVFVTPTIYHSTDEYYYIDKSDSSQLSEGDFVVMADSSNEYRISAFANLSGAYNINNGYCVFRHINILTETGEYYLVDTNTAYGLKVYDHIVMDGSMVTENQVVFNVN